MAKNVLKTQRPYGKKTRRTERAKLLQKVAQQTRHKDCQEMNERFRGGDAELLAEVTKVQLLLKQALDSGVIEERLFLRFVENANSGHPFAAPL